ncbi:MAG: ComEC/Rec2 family competence protein, partial [Bdellovibrionales bacterium]
MLEKPVKFADIEGRIAGIEPLDKGVRLLLTDVVIEGFTPAATPTMTRVKSRSGDGLAVGQRIRALASLNPPSPPVLPGGFDFQRHMYFQGIGALGFLYKKPEVITPASRASMHSMVERLRGFIGRRIVQGEAQPAAGLALALIIGQRKSIDESDLDAIRASGLAHMLAISGLHIGLFSGALFFAARLVMAAFPAFALRRPIKKYAAVIALLGAFFYMLIAGATIPSQRAMMTAAIIFGAVLCDRSPFSLRVVACAAFAILLMFPESLMSASFQMSFAAVTALVAFYDWIRPQWSRLHRKAGMLRRAGLYCIGVSMTSVIASAATAPFALYHFGQIAVYGLLANFICVPVLGFVIMPAAIVALALMPFGLEGIAFAVMAPALDFMLWTARFVAALDGAVWRLPQFSTLCLLFLILAALGMVLLRS